MLIIALRPCSFHLAFVYPIPAFWANEAAYYEGEKHPKRSYEENMRNGLEQFKCTIVDYRVKQTIESEA